MNFNEIYKKIVALENNQPIEECGMGAMPSSMPPQQDSVNMNVNMSGSGDGGIRDLLNILRNLDQSGGDDHGHMDVDMGMPGELEIDGPGDMDMPGDMGMPKGGDDLGQLLKLAGSDKEVLPGNDGMEKGDDEPESDDDKENEAFVNQPDEVYGDVNSVTQDTAGGLNAPHQQFKKEYPGDNPMAESLRSKLSAKYQNYK